MHEALKSTALSQNRYLEGVRKPTFGGVAARRLARASAQSRVAPSHRHTRREEADPSRQSVVASLKFLTSKGGWKTRPLTSAGGGMESGGWRLREMAAGRETEGDGGKEGD